MTVDSQFHAVKPETRDLQKRLPVYTKDRQVVLIKILAMGVITGVPHKGRNDAAIQAKHQDQASAAGLNPHAYRQGKADTGHQKFEKEQDIRVTDLVSQLFDEGLVFTGAHWQNTGKGPVTTLTFERGGNQVSISEVLYGVLALRFNHATVWANMRPDGSRLDTITLAKGLKTESPGRELVITGNTYALI
ncbi:MAG: hypothetical protein Q7R79_01410 [bacterium]|nr:hypothetical protein [bacterium]